MRRRAFVPPPTARRRPTKFYYQYYRPSGNTPLRGYKPVTRRVTGSTAVRTGVRTLGPYVARYLMTKYKKKKLTYKVPQGIGSTFSSWRGGQLRMPKTLYNIWKTNQPFTVSTTFGRKISCNYGQQAVSTINGLVGTDFTDDMTRLGLPTTNSYIKNSTSLIYTNLREVTTFTNVELTTCYIEIFECTPRYHINETNSSPDGMWDDGISDEYGAGGTNVYTSPYERPFRSQKFCLNYNVDKIIRIELAAGESHKHTTTYGINRVIYGEIANKYPVIKNFTHPRMIVASGTPINDQTTKTLVSTSSISIDVVVQRSWDMMADARPRRQTFSSNALSTISAAKVITDTVVTADGSA